MNRSPFVDRRRRDDLHLAPAAAPLRLFAVDRDRGDLQPVEVEREAAQPRGRPRYDRVASGQLPTARLVAEADVVALDVVAAVAAAGEERFARHFRRVGRRRRSRHRRSRSRRQGRAPREAARLSLDISLQRLAGQVAERAPFLLGLRLGRVEEIGRNADADPLARRRSPSSGGRPTLTGVHFESSMSSSHSSRPTLFDLGGDHRPALRHPLGRLRFWSLLHFRHLAASSYQPCHLLAERHRVDDHERAVVRRDRDDLERVPLQIAAEEDEPRVAVPLVRILGSRQADPGLPDRRGAIAPATPGASSPSAPSRISSASIHSFRLTISPRGSSESRRRVQSAQSASSARLPTDRFRPIDEVRPPRSR